MNTSNCFRSMAFPDFAIFLNSIPVSVLVNLRTLVEAAAAVVVVVVPDPGLRTGSEVTRRPDSLVGGCGESQGTQQDRTVDSHLIHLSLLERVMRRPSDLQSPNCGIESQRQ